LLRLREAIYTSGCFSFEVPINQGGKTDMNRLSFVGLLALLGLALLFVRPALALEKGDPAPPLTINPVNDDSDEDVQPLADAEGGVILAFVNGAAIKDDVPEDLQTLIRLFNNLHEEAEEEGARLGYMVVVGEYTEDQISAWAEHNNLTVPISLKNPDDEELKAWDLPGEATAVVYLIEDDSVGQETNKPDQYDDVFGVEEEGEG